MEPVKVALLGCGVVGTEVARLLTTQSDELAARVGAPLELIGIAVRRLGRDRGLPVEESLFTTDAEGLVARADVVIEVIGGIEPARSLILHAFEHGASVVTANKALLAADGPTLYEAAAKNSVDLYYEASVAGAIPLLRPLRESLVGDRVTRVLGIVNGTTNYVLDQMDTTGMGFAEAVEQAQALGYAEADPTADVEGFDAAAKAAILASLSFHTRVSLDDVHREGITDVSAADVRAAQLQGCVVKLLAICERGTDADGNEAVSVRVHPAMLPREHQLAGVRGAFNAVYVEAESAGQLMFYGPGAGGQPTASAVMGDVVAVARHKVVGARGSGESAYAQLAVQPMAETITRYHVRLDVADRPGVLAQVAGVFAAHGVSIEAVQQRQDDAGRAVLVVVTHSATDAALAATVEELEDLEIVDSVAGVLRVEGGDA
ncbi:homoserine dehydrogenase [Kineococcus sp. SYSU DK003]|uniref:homoserine dehydrogenase n=1 Tax=Kineococcus sp. SYSU DK003 TaxID=3383124 RepID=UPI003D7D5C1E